MHKLFDKNRGFIKLMASTAVFVLILASFLTIISLASAQDIESTITTIGQPGSGEILPGFATKGHSDASYEQGASNITSAILFVVDLFKYLIGTVAVLVIIISGIRLITAGNNIEEIAKQQKDNIKYAVIGLIIIIAADSMVRNVFFGEEGEILRSEADVQLAAERGTEEIRGLYSLLSYVAGSIAILMIVYSGVRLLTSGGQEEVIGKMKKTIGYAVMGLILIGIAEFVVKDIVFPQQGEKLVDPQAASRLIVMFTNFVSGFVATVAVAMYMYGGFLYVTAVNKDENTEKAKKVFIGATIGMVLALGAYAIVNTVIKLEPLADTTTTTYLGSIRIV